MYKELTMRDTTFEPNPNDPMWGVLIFLALAALAYTVFRYGV